MRKILASSLGWSDAHSDLSSSLADLSPPLRTARANGFPHSVWELVEHIRITQHDLLDFCVNPKYVELHWPTDYWPSPDSVPSDAEWDASLETIRRDREAMQALTTDESIDLTATIPHGSGQTYLREILLALDHESYHLGQIVAVRRALGAWPA